MNAASAGFMLVKTERADAGAVHVENWQPERYRVFEGEQRYLYLNDSISVWTHGLQHADGAPSTTAPAGRRGATGPKYGRALGIVALVSGIQPHRFTPVSLGSGGDFSLTCDSVATTRLSGDSAAAVGALDRRAL